MASFQLTRIKAISFFTVLCGIAILSACSSPEAPAEQKTSPRFNHVMLYVSDLEASLDFYNKAFDLEEPRLIRKIEILAEDTVQLTRDVNMAFLKFPGQDFIYELSEQKPFPEVTATGGIFQHIGIDVLNIEQAFEQAVNAGAEAAVPVRTVRAEGVLAKQAFVIGPDGVMIEFMQILEGTF